MPWLAGVLALAVGGRITIGVIGLTQQGAWGSPSTDHVVHRLLGEGNPVMRRSNWPLLNLASNTCLKFDIL